MTFPRAASPSDPELKAPAEAAVEAPPDERAEEIARLRAELASAGPRLLELRREIAAMEDERAFARDAGERELALARQEAEGLETRQAWLTKELERLRGGENRVGDWWAEARDYVGERKILFIPAFVILFAMTVFWWLASQPHATDAERSATKAALGLKVLERMGGQDFVDRMAYQEMIAAELDVPEPKRKKSP